MFLLSFMHLVFEVLVNFPERDKLYPDPSNNLRFRVEHTTCYLQRIVNPPDYCVGGGPTHRFVPISSALSEGVSNTSNP
jgi:hypothetical protein